MPCRRAAVLLAVVGLGLTACSGADGPDSSSTTIVGTTDGSAVEDTTTTTLDQSPFCQHVRALEALGADDDPTPDATVEQILAQNEAMLDLLDEIAVTVPDGAPAAVEALLDDLVAISTAIAEAGGDVEAAYADLLAAGGDLADRLQDPVAHDGAFRFFATRCGTPLP